MELDDAIQSKGDTLPLSRRRFLQSVSGASLAATVGSMPAVGEQEGINDTYWQFDIGDGAGSSPSLKEGTAYIGTHDGTLYAVDATSGEERWSFDEPGGEIVSSPAVVDGVVYFGSHDGKLYAIDTDDRGQVWQPFDAPSEINSSPTVVDGTVYFGSRDGKLYAVDADDGSQVWQPFDAPDDRVYSSPVVVAGTIYVGSDDGNVYAVDTKGGNEVWRFEEPSEPVRSSPTYANGTIYVGSLDNTLYAIDAKTGNQEWAFTEPADRVFSSPTFWHDIVYVGSYDGTLYAVNATSGDLLWEFTEPAQPVISSPTIANQTVYVGSRDGNLYGVDAQTGENQFEFTGARDDINSSPVVADGVLYVGSHDGTLYALKQDISGTSEGTRVRTGVLDHRPEWEGKMIPKDFPGEFDPNLDLSIDIEDEVQTISDLLEAHAEERRLQVLQTGYAMSADVFEKSLFDGDEERAAEISGGLVTSVLHEASLQAADVAKNGGGVDKIGGGLAVAGAVGGAVINVWGEKATQRQYQQMLYRLNAADEAKVQRNVEKYRSYITDLNSVEGNWFNEPYEYQSLIHLEDQGLIGKIYDFSTFLLNPLGLPDHKDALDAAAQLEPEDFHKVKFENAGRGFENVLEGRDEFESDDGIIDSIKSQLQNETRYWHEDLKQVNHKKLETYQTAVGRAQEFPTRINQIDTNEALRDLNEEYIIDVFEQLDERLYDSGVGELDRSSVYPPDFVVLPDGTVRNTSGGMMNLPNVKDAYESHEVNDHFTLMDFVDIAIILAGVGLMLLPEPSTTAAGAALVTAKVALVVGDWIVEGAVTMRQLQNDQALLSAYTDIYIETLDDINSIGLVVDDIERWLEAELENPTTGEINGTLHFDDPTPSGFQIEETTQKKIEGGANKRPIKGMFEIDWEFTGDATVPGRIVGYTFRYPENSPSQIQGFVTTNPNEREEAYLFGPDGSNPTAIEEQMNEIECQYQLLSEDPHADFMFFISLIVGGKRVDTATVRLPSDIPDSSVPNVSAAPVTAHSSRFYSVQASDQFTHQLQPYTTAQTPEHRTMTTAEFNQQRGEMERLVSDRLSPGESWSESVSISGELFSASLLLINGSLGEAHLRISDEAGNRIGDGVSSVDGEFPIETETATLQGGSEITLFPETDTTATVEVVVPEEHDKEASVDLFLKEVPERPATIGTNPTELTLESVPGEQVDTQFVITEVGNQEPVQGISIETEPLVNDAGTEIPKESLSITGDIQQVQPSERGRLVLNIEPPESLDLSEGSTRFTGDLLITTENAGTHPVPVSILLLNTGIENADLVTADNTVTRVEVSEGNLAESTSTPPGEFKTVYDVAIEGEGEATIKLDGLTSPESANYSTFKVTGDSYERILTSLENITLSAGEYTILAVDQSGLDETDHGTDENSDDQSDDDTADSDNDANDDSDDADDSGPGFGLPAGIAGLGGAGYLLKERLSQSDEPSDSDSEERTG